MPTYTKEWIARSVAIGAIHLALAACAGAQEAGGPGGSPGPGAGGVLAVGAYTEQQAAFGAEVFALNCASCHGDWDLLAPGFAEKWSGRTLQELYLKIKDTMPENDPGVLSPGQTVEVMAYMLLRQGFPAGGQALEADASALGGVVIHPIEAP